MPPKRTRNAATTAEAPQPSKRRVRARATGPTALPPVDELDAILAADDHGEEPGLPPPTSSELPEGTRPANNVRGRVPRRGARSATILNSTEYPVSVRASNDPTSRLVEVLERTFDSFNNRSLNEGSSRLVNRLTTAKQLPDFSGNALEWLNFKKEYENSTVLGEYSEEENITRLNQAIKGEAREVVGVLLATSRDSREIIETLDLNYGNKRTVAQKIVDDLNNLPSIESGKISLTAFAIKIKNATIAFKNLSLTGYLHSPELVRSVGNKLPSALKYAYNRHAANARSDQSELEKLSIFLYNEAELAISGGIFDVEATETLEPQKTFSSLPSARNVRPGVKTGKVYTAVHESTQSEDNSDLNKPCLCCKSNNHRLWECTQFAKEPLRTRYGIARSSGVCYNCLKKSHTRDMCKEQNACSLCNKRHHTTLHFTENRNNDTRKKAATSPQSGNKNVSGTVNTASDNNGSHP